MHFAEQRALFITDNLAAKIDQNLRNVDLYGTHVIASAAKRRRIGQSSRVLERLQLRRNDSADGTLVDRAVVMSACLMVNRTDIQTSAAADAVHCLTSLAVGQHLSTSVVEQNNMKLRR